MTPFSELERPRVLIIAMAGIGNVLMQSPVLTRLKEVNPRVETTVLVAARGTAEVLERNADISAIFRGNPKPSLREWTGMTAAVRRGRFDIGIVTYPGQRITSSSVLSFGGVPVRIGHRYSLLFRKESGVFLSHALPVRPVHDVAQNLQLLEPLGIPVDLASARYAFPLAREDREAAAEFLRKRDLGETPLIGIHPGAHGDMGYKRWPPERWSELGQRLAEHYGATILIFGGPEERVLKAEIWKTIGRERAVDVELPLRATAALIRYCRFFVSNDSGLMHVAVSQGVPTFGLFGPTDERRTAPWGPSGFVIRATGAQPTYDVTLRKVLKKRQETDPTLLALMVDDVFQRIGETLTAVTKEHP